VAVTGGDESPRLTGRVCVLCAFVVQKEQIGCRNGRSKTGDRGMTIDRSEEYLPGLIQKLCKLPYEAEW